ncbi:helix-turn-helix domain-containing protein [Caulobacter sp. S45]|uniref:helix-turn-helix domain-containing protein n=1 Tax=Caulobacter sp. S45 TaxID=1641861 RepID=UPI00131AF4E5|nr:helix-turn-helix transcriptional regulator [Caulobacter sp. S45]
MEQQQLNMERLRLGTRLRACRTAAGLTRQALADRLQLSKRRIGAFERGAAAISAVQLLELAVIMKAPITDFLTLSRDALQGVPPTAIDLLAATDEGADLAEAFTMLKSRRLRRHVVKLAQELVHQEDQLGA